MSGEKRYFLDTNALVAFGNGEKTIGDLLSDADAVSTSVICELEYLSWEGLTEQDENRFREFLTRWSPYFRSDRIVVSLLDFRRRNRFT